MREVKTDNGLPRLYNWFKAYIRFLFEKVYYKDTYYPDTNNLPGVGESLLIVSNHQNSLIDGIAVALSFRDRLVHFFIKKDMSLLKPIVNRTCRAVGLFPVTEMDDVCLKTLSEGGTVLVYPEEHHQDKHILAPFNSDYVRTAFDAAQLTNFERDIFILPSCNHYSYYFGMRQQVMVKFGAPIPLRQYYSQYQEQAEATIALVDAAVRSQIEDMMLDVHDSEHYEAIDFIRQSDFGVNYAKSCGSNPQDLRQKLASDKKLVSALEQSSDDSVYDVASRYHALLKQLDFSEKCYNEAPRIQDVIVKCLGMVIILPLAIFCAWPSIPSYFITKYYIRKKNDKMYSSSIEFALNAIILIPASTLLTVILGWPARGIVQTIIWVALFPFLCMFEWKYVGWIKQIIENVHYVDSVRNGKIRELKALREEMEAKLDSIIRNS
jgi:1-acyl-sn-glycerol-3-phosphate acyltransferase